MARQSMLAVCVVISVIGVCFGSSHVDEEHSVCAVDHLTDSAGFQQCMDKIIEIFSDNVRFYFGTSFADECAGVELYSSIRCVTSPYLTARNFSMSTVLFPSQDIMLRESLVAFLNVTFKVNKGDSYTGCDTEVHVNQSLEFSVDPASNRSHEPFQLKNAPSYKILMKPGLNVDTSKYYTVIVQDVGSYFMHMVHTNVRFSSSGEVRGNMDMVKPYSGPRNARALEKPYAAIVFEQASSITVSEEWRNIFVQGLTITPTTLEEFMSAYSLTGPVALTWMLTSYDVYAAQLQKQFNILENCAFYVENVLRTHPRPWLSQILPANSSLTVFLSTHISSPEFEFCCREYFYSEVSFLLDPIGSPLYSTAITRTGVGLKFMPNQNKVFPNVTADFQGRHFTMLAVDPDVSPGSTVGSNERPLVHMLATNGAVNNKGVLEFSNTLMEWNGPNPPDVPPTPHYYYFLLMEQTSEITDITIDQLIETNITVECRIRGRCLFDIPRFAMTYNLRLVGASWFRAQRDEYVTYRRDKPSICTRDEDNCDGPVSASVTPVASTILTMALVLLHVVQAL